MHLTTRWIGMGLALGLCSGMLGCGGDDDDTTGVIAGTAGSKASSQQGSGGRGAAGQASAGSGSAGSGKTATQTTLPAGASGKKLSELSPADALQTCQAIAQKGIDAISDDEAARLACTLLSVLLNGQPGADGMLTVDAAKCKQSVADCVMQGATTTTNRYDCDPSKLPAQFMDCDATVGELSTCVDASIATTQMLLKQISCDNVGSMSSSTLQGMQTVPECDGLQAKCPGLDLGGKSSSSGSSEPPSATGCDDTCSDANDGFCDDGGPNADSDFCGLGTDCADCGARAKP